jgi:glutathione S-transferase
LKKKNPFINLPYVVDGDVVVSQTNACLSYLGRKFNLWGFNEAEIIQVEQMLCEIMDLRNDMTKFAYDSSDTHDIVTAASSLLNAVAGKNGYLQKFELSLANEVSLGRSGTFLVGDHATAPDFHLWEMLYQYSHLAAFQGLPSPLEQFPHLKNYFDSFRALPANQAYLSSNIGQVFPSLLPFNQKMARFAAVPSGGPWVHNMAYDFNTFVGAYGG